MTAFLSEDFLLETDTAKQLFHQTANGLPIFDYHCHLSAKEIAENRRFANLTEIWLEGDHYKWRLMRANGIPEDYISGEANPFDKFMAWAKTIPYAIGNPIYHWTHLELQRYFGMDEPLSEQNAEQVWEQCNQLLQGDDFSTRSLLLRSNVIGLCTTDDPLDDLRYHKQLREDEQFPILVLPTFRPDGALSIEHSTFTEWMDRLQQITKQPIGTFRQLVDALAERVTYFHHLGCRLADHGLDSKFYEQATIEEVNLIFQKGLRAEKLTAREVVKYKTALLLELGRLYKKHNWAMQLHIGALRNTNTKALLSMGINAGFDSIADFTYAQDLASLLDSLCAEDQLPKTVIYNLNPRDNYMIASLVGNFQEEIPGKIQFGTAWWFNDHIDGMEEQLKALANTGLLPRFIGMLTDSRSFLSFTRHEYFRRILCNLIGNWVESGQYPATVTLLQEIIEKICYKNILAYLEIDYDRWGVLCADGV